MSEVESSLYLKYKKKSEKPSSMIKRPLFQNTYDCAKIIRLYTSSIWHYLVQVYVDKDVAEQTNF